MPVYAITREEVTLRQVRVEADSPEAALKLYLDESTELTSNVFEITESVNIFAEQVNQDESISGH